MSKAVDAQKILRQHASASDKKALQWFFKSAPGQYGFGDQFIGVKVPKTRAIAKQFVDLPLSELKQLINSPIHEDRLLALVILRIQYERAAKKRDQDFLNKAFLFFYKNRKRINNWDLVDSSAPYISGHFIFHHPTAQKQIFELASSASLWDRRIAMMSTFYFIRQNQFEPTLKLAKILMNDSEDLLHKACGWMLREIGKKDIKTLLTFLDLYKSNLPRTTLRYAIEKLPNAQRLAYLKK